MEARHRILRTLLGGIHATRLDRVFDAFTDARGAIITLHHVRDERRKGFAPNAHLSVTPEFLDSAITDIRARGIDIVSMDEIGERIRSKAAGRFVAITFDDGYRDNAENARPVLEAHDAPYCIYVTTGFVQRTAFLWWEALEALIRQKDWLMVDTDAGPIDLDCSDANAKANSYERLIDHFKTTVPENRVTDAVRSLCWQHQVDTARIGDTQIMSLAEVVEIASTELCTIGAHTATHRNLARLPLDDAREEITRGARELESITGVAPRHFAYPYGFKAAAGAREFSLVRDLGFRTGVTTRRGVLYQEHADHLTALPRISFNGYYQSERYVMPLLSGLPTGFARRFRKLDVA